MKTFLVSLIVLAVISAQASAGIESIQTQKSTLQKDSNNVSKTKKISSKFLKIYQKTLALNRARFKNLNLIHVGDTILLATSDSAVLVSRVVVLHDCIWKIAHRYYNENRLVSRNKVPNKLNEMYAKTLKLNKGRLKNIHKIHVGDIIKLPAKEGGGTVDRVATPHDNIWKMVKKYQTEKSEIKKPVQAVKLRKPNPLSFKTKTEPNFLQKISSIKTFLLLLIVVIILAALTLALIKKFKAYDAEARPTIPGGLDENPLIAVKQLNVAYPQRGTAITFEAGVIKAPEELWTAHRQNNSSDENIPSVKVIMSLADGEHEADLLAGEIYYRITREDGTEDCFAQKSGNLLGTRFREGDKLPEGWELSLYEKVDLYPSGST